jgi:hypothetical protein
VRKILLAVTAVVITASAPLAAPGSPAAAAPRAPIAAMRDCTPDSTAPGSAWFCQGTFTGVDAENQCEFVALGLVASGRASGATCATRRDRTG